MNDLPEDGLVKVIGLVADVVEELVVEVVEEVDAVDLLDVAEVALLVVEELVV